MSDLKMTGEEQREMARLRAMAVAMEPKFETEQEAHNFMMDTLQPCLQQLKTEGCFPSEEKFIRQCRMLWQEVYRHAVVSQH